MSKIILDIGKVAFSVFKHELTKNKMSETIDSHGGYKDEIIYEQKVCGYVSQSFWDRSNGIFVVTNYRIFYKTVSKTFTAKTDYLSVPLELIEDLETTKYTIIPAIQFRANGKKYTFTFLSKSDEVHNQIKEAKKVRIT